jgi:hypothetical protein
MYNYLILKVPYSLLSKLQLKIVIRVKDALLQPLAYLELLSTNNAKEPFLNAIISLT